MTRIDAVPHIRQQPSRIGGFVGAARAFAVARLAIPFLTVLIRSRFAPRIVPIEATP